MTADQMGMEEMMSPAYMRAYVAEFLGTMLFVLIGTGAAIIVLTGGFNAAALTAIAVAHGLGIAVMVYMTAKISGGHINPAVTFAMIVTQRIKPAPGFVYIIAQLLGGVVATSLLYLALNNDVGNISNFGAHGINRDIVDGDGGALLIEMILTAVLVMVIFSVAVAKDNWGNVAPLIIGLTVMAIHFVAVGMTGASVNPARTFGPALISNSFDSFWVYIIGPALGALIGGLLYQFVFLQRIGDTAEVS